MQPEERELIAGLFNRLQPYESQTRDGEAERLIGELVRRQPASPYLLVQTVLVQDQALKAAQARIAELEGKAPQRPTGGFLSSAPRLGPWGARAAMAGVPAGATGGGFLRTALATAAGVAGGAQLFEGVRNLLAGSGSGSLTAEVAQPLPPPDSPYPVDLAQDAAADADYDVVSDDSGFYSGGSVDL